MYCIGYFWYNSWYYGNSIQMKLIVLICIAAALAGCGPPIPVEGVWIKEGEKACLNHEGLYMLYYSENLGIYKHSVRCNDATVKNISQ